MKLLKRESVSGAELSEQNFLIARIVVEFYFETLNRTGQVEFSHFLSSYSAMLNFFIRRGWALMIEL